jgi:Spy/CpxP family protein refolding chaperone
MSLDSIISDLKAERNRIDQAISVLESSHARNGRKPASRKAASVSTPSVRRGRSHLTPAGKQKLSQLMKQRWAERRKRAAKS